MTARIEHKCANNDNGSIHIVSRAWINGKPATWRIAQGITVAKNVFSNIKFCPYCGVKLNK